MRDGNLQVLYQSAERRWLQHWLDGPTLPGNPLRRGDPAPDVELVAEDGSLVALSSYWSQKPALVILWRHLGCGCGLERAAQPQRDYPTYVDSVIRVAYPYNYCEDFPDPRIFTTAARLAG
jgi:hypothetical protein